MLLILAMLLLQLVNVGFQLDLRPMPPEVRDVYVEFFGMIKKTLKWNNTISHQALTRIVKGKGTLRYPCIMPTTVAEFPIGNEIPLAQKVLFALYDLLPYWWEIRNLPNSAPYGCNQLYARKGGLMRVLCFFRTDRPK